MADIGAKYMRWNEALAQHYFRSEFSGRQVLLFVTPDVIADVGKAAGLDPEDFVLCVAGPNGSWEPSQVARRALAVGNEGCWRLDPKHVYPPYLAYLCLFVLAAGADDEDLPAHAYHSRLRRLIGISEVGGALPGFEKVGTELWEDLELWSKQDLDGEYGLFTVHVYGAQSHVGIPRAQNLISQGDVEYLPSVFAAASLDPTSEVTDDALVEALRAAATSLHARTRRVIDRPRDDTFRRALLEVVRAELADWDGSVHEAGGGKGTVFGAMRLCLELKLGAQRGTAYLRCSLCHGYPDGAVTLEAPGLPQLECEEMQAPWSTRLQVDGAVFNAAGLDWSRPFDAVERDLGWQFRMRGGRIRLFEQGEAYQLPDWVEVFRLDRDKPQLVAYPASLAAAIETWGRTCAEFATVTADGALPAAWKLARFSRPSDDTAIRAFATSAGFLNHVALRLVGGLRRRQGTRFFPFAKPSVSIEGCASDEQVLLDGVPLQRNPAGLYPLPDGLVVDERLVVTLRVDGEDLRRQLLRLVGDSDWTVDTGLRVDTFGEVSDGGPGFAGAYCDPPLVEVAGRFRPAVSLPTLHKAVLIGRAPGEVCEWPEDPLPEWEPIWAIGPPTRRRSHRPVVFCGSDIGNSRPLPAAAVDRRLVRRWQEELWVMRKRTDPPGAPVTAKLWGEYLKAARP